MVAIPKRPTEAWVTSKLFENGIGHVLVSRFKGSGEVEAGVFLVDAYCLGVKNAFFTRTGTADYDTVFVPRVFGEDESESLTPGCARKLIEHAVSYAQSLGLAPHPDYKKACRVLGGIDASVCDREFVWGFKGKPLYIQGPHDSPPMVARVMRLLEAHCGPPPNYHYILEVSRSEGAPDDV